MAASNVVSLREITASTVRAVTDLRVTPEQEDYVASNAVSIAQAYFHREAWFRAVYLDECPVGFAMLRDPTLLPSAAKTLTLSLWRFMIDSRFQGAGLGLRAISLLFEHVRARPGVTSLQTSCVAGPHSPIEFYLSCGFREIGETTPSGEVVLVHRLS